MVAYTLSKELQLEMPLNELFGKKWGAALTFYLGTLLYSIG